MQQRKLQNTEKKMLRVTLDTNTLVSAAIVKGNEFQLLNLARLGKIELILSPQILKEFKDVISRVRFGFSQKQISDVFKQVVNISRIIVPSTVINKIKEDSSDNKILECAMSGKVDYIVSGDDHLLNLKKYKDVKIVKTIDILKLI